MKTTLLQILSGFALLVAGTGVSHASAPTEKIICTKAPRSEWLPEARIKEIFEVQRFTMAKLKISRGNCYEFYAVHSDGSIIEAYYNPVTGKEVRYNQVKNQNNQPVYESHTTPPVR
jgi:hypothetical protein